MATKRPFLGTVLLAMTSSLLAQAPGNGRPRDGADDLRIRLPGLDSGANSIEADPVIASF